MGSESLSTFGKHSVIFVDSTFLRANLRWPTTVTVKPKTSRQKQEPYGKTENLTAKPKTSRQKEKRHGKTENLTAKRKTSRQNRKPHGKTENPTAKTKTSRQNRKFCLFCFCRVVFCFCRDSCGSPYESDSNSEI